MIEPCDLNGRMDGKTTTANKINTRNIGLNSNFKKKWLIRSNIQTDLHNWKSITNQHPYIGLIKLNMYIE